MDPLKEPPVLVDKWSVELNLCPSCSAFIHTSWEKCLACGATLDTPAVERTVQWGAPPATAPEAAPQINQYDTDPYDSQYNTDLHNTDPYDSQYNTATFRAEPLRAGDSRLPPVGRGRFIALAAVGPIIFLLGVLAVVFVGTEAKTTSTTAIPPENTTTTSTAPTPNTTLSDGWVGYSDPNSRFTVELPATPEISHSATADGQMTTWVSKSADGHTTSIIVAGALPSGTDWRNNQQVLKNALNAAASSSGMTIKGQYTGNDGNTLHLDALLSNKTASSNVRFFVDNGTLYGLSVSTNDLTGNPQAFDRLTKSFKVSIGSAKPAAYRLDD